MTSGLALRAPSSASRPLVAVPTTSKSPASIEDSVSRTWRWSSTRNTLGRRPALMSVPRVNRRFTTMGILLSDCRGQYTREFDCERIAVRVSAPGHLPYRRTTPRGVELLSLNGRVPCFERGEDIVHRCVDLGVGQRSVW